jgi:hypothetical protein
VKEYEDEMTDEGEGSRKTEDYETTPRIIKKTKRIRKQKEGIEEEDVHKLYVYKNVEKKAN